MIRTVLPVVLAPLMALFSAPGPAYAWDSFGHMLVAYLAYQQLTPETKARANALIRLNPEALRVGGLGAGAHLQGQKEHDALHDRGDLA